jgi:hypothetical protein
MMLGLVGGSLASGQLLSRAGGHYKIQGIIGISLFSIGMALLASMTPEISYGRAVLYIVITGLGLGVTFPLFTVIAQNAAPLTFLGVITSMVPFSRFLGGTLGLAILGSVLNNVFTRQFVNSLPRAAINILSPDDLSALTHNPEALVSPQAQEQIKGILAQFGPQSESLLNQVIQALRQGLGSALSVVFIITFIVGVIALIIHLFIKEIPLRRHN